MKNSDYFKFSQINNDEIIDFSKPEGILVINKSQNEPVTSLMIANHDLIKFITTYQTLKEDIKCDPNYINQVVDKIINIIETTNLINYSSFCVYFQVVGYSFNSYKTEKINMTQEYKRNLLKKLLDLYVANRHSIYLYHGYSDNVLQVNCDSASSRRKGKTGIEKMEDFLKELNFIKVKTILDFKNKKHCYLLPDKGDLELFNIILEDNQIKFDFLSKSLLFAQTCDCNFGGNPLRWEGRSYNFCWKFFWASTDYSVFSGQMKRDT